MTNLAELKAQHPEWCFTCGKYWLEPNGIHTCHENPMLKALKEAITAFDAELGEVDIALIRLHQIARPSIDDARAYQNAIAREEARKKGAEHGE